MHNQFNQALRNCFQLEQLEEKVSSDLKEMSARLQELSAHLQTALAIEARTRREQFEREHFYIPYIITAGIVVVTVAQTLSSWLAFADSAHYSRLAWVVAIALALSALLSWVYVYLRGKHFGGEH